MAVFRAMGRGRNESEQEQVERVLTGFEDARFLIDRMGAESTIDPDLAVMLLDLRRRLRDEYGTGPAAIMLIDRAVSAYQDFIRVTGWIGNLSIHIEREFFGRVAPKAEDHQPVLQPEFDHVKERLLPLHAATERFCAPSLARSDAFNFFGFEWHGQQRMERPGMGRSIVRAEDNLVVPIRNIERRAVRVNLDHGSMLVAACCHVGSLERPEWMALTTHQFGEDLGYALRLARWNRYVMDHEGPPMLHYRGPDPRLVVPTATILLSGLAQQRAPERCSFRRNVPAIVQAIARGRDN